MGTCCETSSSTRGTSSTTTWETSSSTWQTALRKVKCAQCGRSFRGLAIGAKAAKVVMQQYCKRCWTHWTKKNRRAQYFQEEDLTPPVKYVGKAVRNFTGERVHVLQIGLGTFGTFLKPDMGWILTLLEAPIENGCRPQEEDLRGIGVDCLEESCGLHEQLAQARPKCSVLNAAVDSSEGSRTLWCLPRGARMEVRQWMLEQKAPLVQRVDANHHLAYLENMSSIGDEAHPDLMFHVKRVADISKYEKPLLEKRTVECLTYEGVLRRHNATGCDILIVDAEGADCAIVNGMITMCQKGFSNWPTLLRYETRAENYDLYGRPAEGGANPEEENMIVTLQKEGYLVLEVGGDATLIYGPNLTPSDRCLGEWANYYYSLTCYVCNKRVAPWPYKKAFGKEVGRGSNQWRGTKKDQEIVRWDTSIVLSPGCRWCCQHCYENEGTLGGDAPRGSPRRPPPRRSGSGSHRPAPGVAQESGPLLVGDARRRPVQRGASPKK